MACLAGVGTRPGRRRCLLRLRTGGRYSGLAEGADVVPGGCRELAAEPIPGAIRDAVSTGRHGLVADHIRFLARETSGGRFEMHLAATRSRRSRIRRRQPRGGLAHRRWHARAQYLLAVVDSSEFDVHPMGPGARAGRLNRALRSSERGAPNEKGRTTGRGRPFLQ